VRRRLGFVYFRLKKLILRFYTPFPVAEPPDADDYNKKEDDAADCTAYYDLCSIIVWG
jgi:hypothetical protein